MKSISVHVISFFLQREMLLGHSSKNARIGPQSPNILKIKMLVRTFNATAAEILVESCPRGNIVKVGSFVRHTVCKNSAQSRIWWLANEVMKSMMRGLVSGSCVNKCDCTKLGSYENARSVSYWINIKEEVLWLNIQSISTRVGIGSQIKTGKIYTDNM